LDIKGLDFNQLLQRDLDDHRVATNLIPYLLRPKKTGPAFFPPIMAVMLPFDGKSPVEKFPTPDSSRATPIDGARFRETRFGSAFRVLRLLSPNSDDDLHPTFKVGRVEWNEERAKLVVLDGQHRAMALLAIDRTLNKSWAHEGAARYSHFYETRVRRLLDEARFEDESYSLDGIEIPVTICWFPDASDTATNPHRAARKLFVDVNKEARTPSEARLTLLSDGELINILTRTLLNRLRAANSPLPLYAVEYDNPEKDVARPVKWTVLSNLNFLKTATEIVVFGPKKYVRDVGSRFGGRKPLGDMDAYMREQLDLVSLFQETIVDDDRRIDRKDIGNQFFPTQHAEKLAERFMATWGRVIFAVLSSLAPYRAHSQALVKTYENWTSEDESLAPLAREALFEGVGMYWTLRSSKQHWDLQREDAKRLGKEAPAKPEIVQVWEMIETGCKKQQDFNATRAHAYLGAASARHVEGANAFFDVANTNACQLGAVMAIATLSWKCAIPVLEVGEFAELVVAAWNNALATSPGGKRDSGSARLLILSKAVANPVNRIRKLDTPLAVYFRYFWLELLRVAAARELLGSRVDSAALDALVGEAREFYLFGYLIPEQEKALEDSGVRTRNIHEKARKIESEKLRGALSHWFELPEAEFEAWLDGVSASRAGRRRRNEEEDEPLPTQVGDDSPAVSLDDLLGELGSPE
jgi:hypothetical protein